MYMVSEFGKAHLNLSGSEALSYSKFVIFGIKILHFA